MSLVLLRVLQPASSDPAYGRSPDGKRSARRRLKLRGGGGGLPTYLQPGMLCEWMYSSRSRMRNKRLPRIRTEDISLSRTIRSIVASEIRK
jgi:hypothetical protein